MHFFFALVAPPTWFWACLQSAFLKLLLLSSYESNLLAFRLCFVANVKSRFTLERLAEKMERNCVRRNSHPLLDIAWLVTEKWLCWARRCSQCWNYLKLFSAEITVTLKKLKCRGHFCPATAELHSICMEKRLCHPKKCNRWTQTHRHRSYCQCAQLTSKNKKKRTTASFLSVTLME